MDFSTYPTPAAHSTSTLTLASTGTRFPAAADLGSLRGFWHDHATALITRPVQVIVVVVVALLIRAIAHRAIDSLTRSGAEGKIPKILSPLTERAAGSSLLESSGLRFERRRQRADTVGSVLKSTVSFLLFVTGFLVILDVIGLNLLPFVAGTSLIGVAIGFGAQNIVKDFLSGMFMILEDQYGVGDVIDVKEATGTVEAVGLRTTRIRDIQGTVWYVRNGEIVRVGNHSQQFAQVVIDVAIGIEEDLDRAMRELSTAASGVHEDVEWHSMFLAAPEILGIEELSRDEVTLRVVARVRPLEQWRVARELRARILQRLTAARVNGGIESEES